MAYYERSDSYYDYGDYHGDYSDSRRNSNSFSEEINGAKRKKTNWGGRGKGNRQFSRGGGNRNASPRNINIDTPIFQEPPTRSPKRTPPVPRRAQQAQAEARKRGRERNNSFRSNPKPYFDMREMPDFVEPEHTGPSWQWDNYARGCKNWQDKHKLAYYQSRCTALEFENQMLFEQINKLIKENIVFATERGKTPTMEVPQIPGFESQETRASTSKNQGKSSQLPDSGSHLEFNLSEDVVEYLEVNIRNKLTLKKEKLSKEKSATGKSSDKESAPKGSGVKRKEELDQLYGKNSSLIQGLETSLQLNFNRNCDTFKPEFYPATPFNAHTLVA